MAWHAKLHSSGTKQWWNCPGSLAYIQFYHLESGSGYHAQLGTAAHLLVEVSLTDQIRPSEYKGRLIQIVGPGTDGEHAEMLPAKAKWPKDPTAVVFEVDNDMIEAVECMTDYIYERVEELGLSMKNVRLETKVIPLPERNDTGGTGDVLIDGWPIVLEVVDYKHGQGVYVPIENNYQLRSYGLGALQEAGADDYEQVRNTICQPRHRESPPNGISSEDITPADLFEFKKGLTKAAERVDEARVLVAEGATLEDLHAKGMLSVGEDGSHCYFCEIKTDCPAALALVQRQAGIDFDFDEPGELDPPTEDKLSTVLPWVPFIQKLMKAIVAKAEEVIIGGGEVEGHKLVRKRANRKWITERLIASEVEGEEPTVERVTEDNIVAELVKDFEVKAQDLFKDPGLKTGPQIEKLIPKEKRKEFNNRLMFKPEGGLTIAPVSDKRAAVTVNPADDFEGVED